MNIYKEAVNYFNFLKKAKFYPKINPEIQEKIRNFAVIKGLVFFNPDVLKKTEDGFLGPVTRDMIEKVKKYFNDKAESGLTSVGKINMGPQGDSYLFKIISKELNKASGEKEDTGGWSGPTPQAAENQTAQQQKAREGITTVEHVRPGRVTQQGNVIFPTDPLTAKPPAATADNYIPYSSSTPRGAGYQQSATQSVLGPGGIPAGIPYKKETDTDYFKIQRSNQKPVASQAEEMLQKAVKKQPGERPSDVLAPGKTQYVKPPK